MATNLLIGHADIPNRAASVTGSWPIDGNYPIANLFGGNRTELFKTTSGVSTNITLTYMVNTARASNFLYVGNANLLQKEGCTGFWFSRSTSNIVGASTTVVNINNLQTEPLWGVENTDIIKSFDLTGTNQYWFTTVTKGSAAGVAPMSKVFFGQSFDMGRDPDLDEGLDIVRFHDHPSQRRPLYRVNLVWDYVAKDTTIAFYQNYYLQRRYRPVVLFTTSYHQLLNNHRVLFGRFTELSIPPKVTNFNTISATFEEVA